MQRAMTSLVAADLVKIKRALISVSDKTDLLVLAAALKDCGVQVRQLDIVCAAGVAAVNSCCKF